MPFAHRLGVGNFQERHLGPFNPVLSLDFTSSSTYRFPFFFGQSSKLHSAHTQNDCPAGYVKQSTRWYTQDGKNRGRVMARTVAKTLEAMGVTVWLDQQQMSRQATREQVIAGIHKAFQRAQYVIILAAPGDWDRFGNEDDIHRWEWEISLKSRKPVWVLQYETICPRLDLLQTNLVQELLLFSNFLADLVLKRSIEVRSLTTENFYDVLKEITKGPCIKTL